MRKRIYRKTITKLNKWNSQIKYPTEILDGDTIILGKQAISGKEFKKRYA